jgi:hypothetical protein
LNSENLKEFLEKASKEDFNDFSKSLESRLEYGISTSPQLEEDVIYETYELCKNDEILLCEFFAFCVIVISEWKIFLKNFYCLPEYIQDYIRDNYYLDTISFPNETLEDKIQIYKYS